MRSALLSMLLVACGPPAPVREPVEPMSSETLDHQDPKADTSHHPVHYVGGGGHFWSNWHPFGGGGVPDAFANTGSPPHYYTGCGGCASDDPASLLVLLLCAPAFVRRRRILAPCAT